MQENRNFLNSNFLMGLTIGLFLIFLISPNAFAQIQEVEIQLFVDGKPTYEQSTIIEQNIQNDLSNSEKPVKVYDEFVTDSEYAVNGIPVKIQSIQGQKLNQILVDQIETRQENFLHKIQYWDRYGDGIIEIAEALVDPVSEQKYLINGRSLEYYPNSNVEYFLLERGYNLDDPESIPNEAFSPPVYNNARQLIDSIANPSCTTCISNNEFDLRLLSPNYILKDENAINEMMIADLTEQTNKVFDDIVNPSQPTINILQLEQSDGLYQNTEHIKELISIDSNKIEFRTEPIVPLDLILILAAFAGATLVGIVLVKRYAKKKPQIIIPQVIGPSLNYLEITQNILSSALQLFKENDIKLAHERFSQAIRYYYSNKFEKGTEMTNIEVLYTLEHNKVAEFKNIQDWLDMCSMVEFAKQKSNEKKFINALTEFLKIIEVKI